MAATKRERPRFLETASNLQFRAERGGRLPPHSSLAVRKTTGYRTNASVRLGDR
jgi:hypothetical protein